MAESGVKKRGNVELTPTRSLGGRLRKPNPRIFGSDDDEYPSTPKPRKQTKTTCLQKSSSSTSVTVDRRALLGRLRNVLKLPKAHLWVCHEWFYSNIDRALFLGENDFEICLKECIPDLKTHMLTRVQWCMVRRLMGKPRRCSSAFFAEERGALEKKRQKIRLLQQRKIENVGDLTDLPSEIPMSLVIGTKVTARLRRPQDGIFDGVIDALDPPNNSYRITFDRPGIGTQYVQDVDVFSIGSYETIPLSSFQVRKRPLRHSLFSSPRFHLTSSPKDGEYGRRSPGSVLRSLPTGDTIGGFPIKFLLTVTKLTKLLGVKKELLKKIKDLNTEAEKEKSYGHEIGGVFQQRYARLILDLERLNSEINSCLESVRQFSQKVDPDLKLSILDHPSEVKKISESEADTIVHKINGLQPGRRRIRSEKHLELISRLMSILLQIRTFADSEMHSFEFKSLRESLDDIKSSLDPSNIGVFEDNVEIHINHIQNGLTLTGNLQAFSTNNISPSTPQH